jgi:hypothetical protein
VGAQREEEFEAFPKYKRRAGQCLGFEWSETAGWGGHGDWRMFQPEHCKVAKSQNDKWLILLGRVLTHL